MGVSNSNPVSATVQNHLDMFNAGFEVAYTYNTDNAVEARAQINAKNSISPAVVY